MLRCLPPSCGFRRKEQPKNDVSQQQTVAVNALEKALTHWKRLAEPEAKSNQLPVLLNFTQPFFWNSLSPAVEKVVGISRIPPRRVA